MSGFNLSTIKKYDIRGIFPSELNWNDGFHLGLQLGRECAKRNLALCIGYDLRNSSPHLYKALVKGAFSASSAVITIGQCTTPLLYFASYLFANSYYAVMITASHNPDEYNGFKIVCKGRPLIGNEIFQILANKQSVYQLRSGEVRFCDILQNYIAFLSLNVDLKTQYNLVNLNTSGSTIGLLTPLFYKLGLATQQLSAPYQVYFDGDGDRIIIALHGKTIHSDHLFYILCLAFIKKMQDSYSVCFVVDVKMSQIVINQLKQYGNVVVHQTGHSLIKQKILQLLENNPTVIAGEASGHFFYTATYNGIRITYDDALLSALQFASFVETDPAFVEDCLHMLASASFLTPELYIYQDYEVSNCLIEALKQLATGTDITIDGIRLQTEKGWWLIRQSNTEPKLVLRAELYSIHSKSEFLAELEFTLKAAIQSCSSFFVLLSSLSNEIISLVAGSL